MTFSFIMIFFSQVSLSTFPCFWQPHAPNPPVATCCPQNGAQVACSIWPQASPLPLGPLSPATFPLLSHQVFTGQWLLPAFLLPLIPLQPPGSRCFFKDLFPETLTRVCVVLIFYWFPSAGPMLHTYFLFVCLEKFLTAMYLLTLTNKLEIRVGEGKWIMSHF